MRVVDYRTTVVRVKSELGLLWFAHSNGRCHAVGIMHRLTTPSLVFVSALLFVACTDTTGLSAESSREPKGNPDAPVVVMEYADFQCPACGAAYTSVVEPLMEQYGDRIRFEFKHFPIQSIHPYALRAAMAAECAADQDKFWEYTHLVFSNQSELSARALEDWAAELRLDTDLFKRCVDSQIKRDTVLADYQEGRANNVNGTPTFFVNGEITPTNQLMQAVDQAYADLTQRL